MSTLRIALVVLGALATSACRGRVPQRPAAAPPGASAPLAGAATPSLAARRPPRASYGALAPTDSGRERAGEAATIAAAGPPAPAAPLLLVRDRSKNRPRATLVAERFRASGPAGAGVRGLGLGARPIAPRDSLFQPQVGEAPAKSRAIRPVVIVALADHRVDPGTGVEKTSSLMYGVGFEATTRGWLSVRGEITTGTLAANRTGVRALSVTDARLDLGVSAFPWLTLLAGGGLRVYKQDAQENWRFLRVGAEARFPLGVDALTGMVRFTLSPVVSRTTSAPSALSPSFAVAGASGLRLTYRLLSVGVEYAIESYTFPSSGGITRQEEFSGLKLQLGLNLGW